MSSITKVVVKGDTATIIEERELRTIELKEFGKILTENGTIETEWLPSGCIRVLRKGDIEVYVIEQEPQTISTPILGSEEMIKVKMPRTLFFIAFKKAAMVRAFIRWAPSKIENDQSMTTFAPVRNVWASSKVCSGSMGSIRTSESVAMKCAKMIALFWGSKANGDLDESSATNIDHIDETVEEKARESSSLPEMARIWKAISELPEEEQEGAITGRDKMTIGEFLENKVIRELSR